MPAPYLTMADICSIYRIPPRTARRWAEHDRWRRTSSRPRRYNIDDADASYYRHQRKRLTHHRVKQRAPVTGGT